MRMCNKLGYVSVVRARKVHVKDDGLLQKGVVCGATYLHAGRRWEAIFVGEVTQRTVSSSRVHADHESKYRGSRIVSPKTMQRLYMYEARNRLNGEPLSCDSSPKLKIVKK